MNIIEMVFPNSKKLVHAYDFLLTIVDGSNNFHQSINNLQNKQTNKQKWANNQYADSNRIHFVGGNDWSKIRKKKQTNKQKWASITHTLHSHISWPLPN